METKEIVAAVKAEVLALLNGTTEKFNERVAALEAKGFVTAETAKQMVEEAKAGGASRMDALEALLNRSERAAEQPSEQKGLARIIFEDEQFKELAKKSEGNPGRPGRIQMIMKSSLFPESREFKTLIDSSAVGSSTPGILVPQRVGGIIPAARRMLRLRDLMTVYTTQNNAVEYVKENAFTNSASPQGSEGTAKAESALTFTIASAAVTTIAHWIPASKQVLADFNELQRYVEQTLMFGLKLKEETELLSGDGLGTHLNGLTTQATAYAGTYNAAGDTQADKLRHFITELEVANEQCNFFVLNPIDYAKVELIKTEEGGANKGMYVIGNPRVGGDSFTMVPTLWGRPVVLTNSMASGKALAGDITKCAIYDRQVASLELSTEYSDYFVKNLVAMLCEERLAFAVFRAGAFRYGTI